MTFLDADSSLARDQFNDRLAVRSHLERKQLFQRIDDEAGDQATLKAKAKLFQKFSAAAPAIPPHTTS